MNAPGAPEGGGPRKSRWAQGSKLTDSVRAAVRVPVLFEDDGLDLGHTFQDEWVFEEDLAASEESLGRAQPERGGQSERARARDDQNGGECLNGTRPLAGNGPK